VDFTPAQGWSSSRRVVQVRFGSNADTRSKINGRALFIGLPRSIPFPTIHAGNAEDSMAKRPMYLQHVNVYVRNVERSKKWYEDLLGLHVYEYRPGWAAFLTADKEQSHEVALMQLGEDAPLPLKRQVGLNHMAWRLESLDDLKAFYEKVKAERQPIDHISDHGISLGIYLRDPDGNGVEVFYEMPRAEWPVDYNVFTREKTGSGRFPGPWDAEIGRDGPPARRQAAAE
jgi:catechol 2,3-dioxygenase